MSQLRGMLVALAAVSVTAVVAFALRTLVPGAPISFLPFVPAILLAASYFSRCRGRPTTPIR
jgi:hypothetical protein